MIVRWKLIPSVNICKIEKSNSFVRTARELANSRCGQVEGVQQGFGKVHLAIDLLSWTTNDTGPSIVPTAARGERRWGGRDWNGID